MSKIFKSIAKVFKSVVKFVIKIAPYALAAAAVVFTGGAALGLLPTFGAAIGGLVGSLGLSGALAGALTGGIVSAGFGAALGFVTGGTKGMKKGALMGFLTGGVLGAVNPTMFGGAAASAAKGIAPVEGLSSAPVASLPGGLTADTIASLPQVPDLSGVVGASIPDAAVQIGQAAQAGSQAAVAQAGQGIAPLAAPQSLLPVDLSSAPASSLPGGLTSTTVSSLPGVPAAGSSSFIQSLLGGQGGVGGNMPSLVGSVLQSLGGSNQSKDAEKATEKLGKFAYGGVYTGKANPFGIPGSYTVPQPRFYYDKNRGEVVDRQQPQGA